MHVLVECAACRRQSDAGELAVGSRFHCLCGAVLEVPRVRAKDAAVVRCSACGGPRTGGAASCTFCGADFTIHERQLHTICPGCMTRILDRAKFCHHCGAAILVEGRSGEPTEHPCPACGPERRLDSRAFGEPPVAVMECRVCAGLWLGAQTFEILMGRAGEKAAVGGGSAAAGGWVAAAGGDAAGRRRSTAQSGPLYRRCPLCDQMMARRNFARRSGVIVDSCREHGLWFDAGELDALLEWTRQGGRKEAEKRDREEAREAGRAGRLRAATSRVEKLARAGGGAGAGSMGSDAAPLLKALGRLFILRH